MNTTLPPFSGPGQNLSVDQVQLKRVQQQPYDVVGSFKAAFELLKENPGERIAPYIVSFCAMFAVAFVIGAVFTAISNFVVLAVAATMPDTEIGMIVTVGVGVVMHLVQQFFITIVQAIGIGALVSITLRVVRGQPMSFGNLTDFLPVLMPTVLCMILVSLAVAFGTLFLIVPGVIVSLGFIFWSFVIVDKGLGPIDSMKASWRLTSGHKMGIFLYLIVAAMLMFAGVLCCGVGALFAFPVNYIALGIIYNALAEPGNAYLAR